LRSKPGEALASWETTNGFFRLRVTSYKEKLIVPGPAGADYIFSSSTNPGGSWQDVMMLYQDDRVELPRDDIRFIGDSTGYIFMKWMFAVTTDAGKTWSVWNATTDVADWTWDKYGVIRDVQISADGSGLLLIQPLADPNRVDTRFRTADFGRHWKEMAD
jgi:hypothetical protein